jgi:putative DNA-invertase from lambdoid prophage Rac
MTLEKRVAIYIRVSTEHQNLDLQKNELLQYCEIRKWSDVKIYSDFGISGSRTDNRPEFKRMMKDAKARRIDAVIVWKLDRFGRSLIDLVNHLQELADLGVEFISLRDGIDLSTSAGKLMCGLIASFAQYERDILKERTIAGLAAARKRGKVLGRPKQRDDAAIAELRNQGFSIQAIAKQLQVSKGSVQAALAACTKNPFNFRRSA